MSRIAVGVDRLEGLLGWIHETPEMYCLLAGELDSVLNYLHFAWVVVKDREHELLETKMAIDPSPAGRLSEADRVRRVQRGDYATERVLDYWSRVDTALGVKRFRAQAADGE